MRTIKSRNSSRAFTLIDALVLVTGLLFLAAFLLPRFANPTPHRRSSRITCVNKLKQVGLVYRIWAGDNNDRYPMAVSTNQGGSMELVLAGDVVSTFQVMSNELLTPETLLCPNDTKRRAATNFSVGFSRANLSYFVGVDATETNVTMFLSGDRNITNGTTLRGGFLELSTNRLSGWTREIHDKVGNIGLADGSVQQLTTIGLRNAVVVSGVATNRLAMP